MVFMLGIPCLVKAQESGRMLNLKIHAAVGYSVENFDWSIAGKGANAEPVNILSELKWKKSAGPCLHLHGEWHAWKGLFVRADISKTFVTSGKVSDTDFGKNDRRDTLFHDIFNSDRGGIIGYSAAIGYDIRLMSKHTISPFAGYRNDSQSLYLLRNNGNVQGDLKSTYQTKWNGLLAGLDVRVCIYEKLMVTGRITYHQVSYSAKADWNLIGDFKHPVSFKHQAKGYGLEAVAGLEYFIGKKISTLLTIAHGYRTTGRGTDTLYRTNGDIVATPLNPVHRNNLTLSAGIQMAFD
jgi:hypothetical protein